MVSQDEVAGELFAKGSLSTLAEMLVCDLSYKVLHVQQ